MIKYSAAELAETFAETLARLSRVLDAQGQPWMLIGGIAVGAWTEPRATNFAVALPADVAAFAAALQAEGLKAARGSFEEVAAEGGVVRLRLEARLDAALAAAAR